MITPDLILTHLYKYLPAVTDRFTESVQAISASITNDLQLSVVVTSAAQFEIGRRYNVGTITMQNPVLSIVGSASAGYTLTTDQPHRLTAPRQPQDAKTFELSSGWPLSPITSVTADTVFTRNGEATAPTGASLLESVRVGYVELLSKSGNTLIFALPDDYFYPCVCTVDRIVTRLNIAVVVDADRAQQVYANACQQTTGLWAFIIMGDRQTIPSVEQQAGVVAEGKRNVDDLLVSTTFSLLIVWPTKTDESARAHINQAYGEIYAALNQCLLGAKLDSVYRIAPIGSGLGQIATLPNYAHVYDYQALDCVDVLTDGLRNDMQYFDVPIRTVDGQLLIDCGLTEPQAIEFEVITNEGG